MIHLTLSGGKQSLLPNKQTNNGFLRLWCLSTLKKFWRCIQGWTCILDQISRKFLKFKDGNGRSCTSVTMPEVTSRVYSEKSKVRLSSQVIADSSTYGQWVTIYVTSNSSLITLCSLFSMHYSSAFPVSLIPSELIKNFCLLPASSRLAPFLATKLFSEGYYDSSSLKHIILEKN